MLELVDMEMRDLLAQYGYDGEATPIIMGSGLAALEGRDPEIGESKVEALMAACDEWLDAPIRDLDKPFLLPVEGESSFSNQSTQKKGKAYERESKRNERVVLVPLSPPLLPFSISRSLLCVGNTLVVEADTSFFLFHFSQTSSPSPDEEPSLLDESSEEPS